MGNARRLTGVRIRRYKVLEDIEFSGLGDFNVLLGANDVGKTTVLEALFLVTGCANAGLPIAVHNHRMYVVQSFEDLLNLFHRLDARSPIELTADSTSPEERRHLKISGTTSKLVRDSAHQHLRTSGAAAAQNGGPDAQSRFASTIARESRVLRYEATLTGRDGKVSFSGDVLVRSTEDIDVPLDPQAASQMVIPARIIMPGLGYDTAAISELIVNKRDSELLEILRAINPNIQRIAVDGELAYLDAGLDRLIPLNMFGGGMVRAAVVVSYCILGNHRVLLIDEIENGFHHTTLRPLLRALLALSAQRGVQIFSTTHSVEVLKHLRMILGEDKYASLRSSTVSYALAKDRDGRIRSYKYEFPEFDHCIAHDIEIR